MCGWLQQHSNPLEITCKLFMSECTKLLQKPPYIYTTIFITFASPRNFFSRVSVFGSNDFQCFQGAPHCHYINFLNVRWIMKLCYNYSKFYLSLNEAAIADVTLLNEGTHAPGKINSSMKSEFRLYSS